MNTFIWILQGLIAFIFLFSGVHKAYFDEKTLVAKGQTGVEGLAPAFIKFIGITELFGAIGLILPEALQIYPILTPISAICLGLIMVPAAVIHFKRAYEMGPKRKELSNVGFNVFIFILCGIIAWARLT